MIYKSSKKVIMRTDAVMMMAFVVLALSAAVVPGARADFFDAKQGLNSMQLMMNISLINTVETYFYIQGSPSGREPGFG